MMVEWRERKRFVEVHGRRMAWVEEGAGAAVVFLHGNPTSSFLWRDVMAAMVAAGFAGSDESTLQDGSTLDHHFGAMGGWISSTLVRVGDLSFEFHPPIDG